jgi:hypothetical protein
VDDSARWDSRRSRDLKSWVTALVYASSALVEIVSYVLLKLGALRETYDAKPDL